MAALSELWTANEDIILTTRSLCEAIRNAVRPHLGRSSARSLEGRGASGDTTFGIDEVAERKVEQVLSRRPDIACYTEDRGVIVPDEARYLFIIDPIDGTRPAAAGLESCCVSIAVALIDGRDPYELEMGDVFYGVVSEIKERAIFSAVRGAGAVIEIDGKRVPPNLTSTGSLDTIFWTAGYRGRPALPLTTVMEQLIDSSSVDGGYFDLGSATYSVTRVITGQMDVYVDVGQRMVEEIPALREKFLDIGHGNVLNNYPYDLAAVALIASEAGAIVTDAAGQSLESHPLIPTDGGGQLSSLISSNEILHSTVLASLDRGMETLAAQYR